MDDGGASIPCPVCNYDLRKFELVTRAAHVEACLNPPKRFKGSWSHRVATKSTTKTTKTNGTANGSSSKIKREVSVDQQMLIKRKVSVKQEVLDDDDVSIVEVKKEPTPSTGLPIKQEAKPSTSISVKQEATTTVKREGTTTPKTTNLKSLPPKAQEQHKFTNKPQTTPSLTKQIKPPKTLVLRGRAKRDIPPVKIMTFQTGYATPYTIAVDAFNFNPHPIIDTYVLTHFHGDHYGGISKQWSYQRVFGDDPDYDNDAKYRHIILCTRITGELLTMRFSVDPRFIQPLELDTRYCLRHYTPDGVKTVEVPSLDTTTAGLYVTPILANHCPGAGIFLFETITTSGSRHYQLHCGDFRVSHAMLMNPALQPFHRQLTLEKVYLDTTYMSPEYIFPKQETVCETVADLFHTLCNKDDVYSEWFGGKRQARITDMLFNAAARKKKKKFLVLVGTYLIGKEKLAIAILRKMNCPIYVLTVMSRNDKGAILATYHDEYLDLVMTTDELGGDGPHQVVVHLVPMSIVGKTDEMCKYFNHNGYQDHFEHCIGIRPTGWSFVPGSRGIADKEGAYVAAKVPKTLATRTEYNSDAILSQSPKPAPAAKKRANPEITVFRVYSVPYSEHLSFRELAFFVVFLNIKQVIPTVNEQLAATKMAQIIAQWQLARSVRELAQSVDYAEVADIFGVDEDLVESLAKLSLDDF
ncbi:hypothetical protein JNB11_00825 [Kocuria palustris]|nr:hypothetical protein [Kocuria palustris]